MTVQTIRASTRSLLEPDTIQAWSRLTAALDELAFARRSTPCQVLPDLWLSDERPSRRRAAEACRGCPVLELCADYAEAAGEAYVWGGRDRSPRVQPPFFSGGSELVSLRPPDPSPTAPRHASTSEGTP